MHPLILPMLKMAEQAKVHREPAIQAMLTHFGLTGNERMGRDLGALLSHRCLRAALDPYPFQAPHGHELSQDGMVLGKVKNARQVTPFFVPPDWIPSHVLITGRTGCGKTTLLYWFLCNLIRQRVPAVIFDQKQDFRHVLRLYQDMLVVRVIQDFRFNPLAVPRGVSPLVWAEVVTDVMCREFGFLGGARAVLLKGIITLYRRHGVLDGSRDFPTLFDVLHWLNTQELYRASRRWQSTETIVGRLEALLLTHEEMFNCVEGFPLEDLFQRPCVVFETDGLAEDYKAFLINLLMQHSYQQRLATQRRGQGLAQAFLLDEASHFLHPFQSEEIGFSAIDTILNQAREFGIGLIASSQTAHLNPAIYTNSFLKLCFSLGNGEDIERIKTVFQLDDEQTIYLTGLKTGEAIVKCPRFDVPFVIQVPPFPLK